MATRAWNANDSAGADAANTIDDADRRIRADVLDRLMQGGRKFAGTAPPASSAAENDDGKACIGVETQTFQTDAGYLTLAWDFAGTTRLVRLYGSDYATTALQKALEIPGDLVTTAGVAITKSGKAVAAFQRATIGDPWPVASTGANTGYLKRVVYKVPSFTGAPTRTLTKVMLIVGTKPVGTDLVVKIRQLTTPGVTVNRYLDASSSVIATVTLTAAGNFAVETTGLDLALALDDELVLQYGTVGTTTNTADLTVILQIE